MPDTPNFPELLGPHIAAVPATAVPNFLARLERGAAQCYREWAPHYEGEGRAVILACAAREDEIADRVDRLFPVDSGDLQNSRAKRADSADGRTRSSLNRLRGRR